MFPKPKIVPIWIRLPNLNLHYYSAKSLGKLARFIGQPSYIDKHIVNESSLLFARLGAEIM